MKKEFRFFRVYSVIFDHRSCKSVPRFRDFKDYEPAYKYYKQRVQISLYVILEKHYNDMSFDALLESDDPFYSKLCNNETVQEFHRI